MIYPGEKNRVESVDKREHCIFFALFLFVVNVLQGKYINLKNKEQLLSLHNTENLLDSPASSSVINDDCKNDV